MEGSTSKRPLENPEENSNPSKKVRKAYSLEFKRNVLDEVKSSNNLRATAGGVTNRVVFQILGQTKSLVLLIGWCFKSGGYF